MGEATRRTKRERGKRLPPLDTSPDQVWRRGHSLLGFALLLLVAAAAFGPAFSAGFLQWDDQVYVAQNDLLHDTAGLAEIWDPSSSRLPAYYPAVFTSYWLEFRAWGLNPHLYHATNFVLHLANSALALALARQLGASPAVALATAAIFALHPVQAQSVTWIAERKNVLSGFFYFATFLLYLRHRREKNDRVSYALCLLTFTAALLSKTQTVTLPAAILLYEVLIRPGPRQSRDALGPALARVAPMFALGVAAGLVTTQFEHRLVQPWYEIPSAGERPLVAARAAWFYAGKFLLPVNLAPLYPKWPVASPGSWAALLAWPLVFALTLRWWHRIPPLTLWGSCQFLLSVVPALGLLPFSWQHFSFVGNHLLYLSCFGGGLAVALLAESLVERTAQPPVRSALAAIGLLLFVGLAVQTHRETRYWHDDISLAIRVVEQNQDSWIANHQLGRRLREQGRFDEALDPLRRALDLARPMGRADQVLQDYFRVLDATQGPDAVIRAATLEIGRDPASYVAYLYRALSYERVGSSDASLEDLDRVIELAAPGSVAWRMATSGNRRLRNRTR